jgi:hypothetical protein
MPSIFIFCSFLVLHNTVYSMFCFECLGDAGVGRQKEFKSKHHHYFFFNYYFLYTVKGLLSCIQYTGTTIHIDILYSIIFCKNNLIAFLGWVRVSVELEGM